VACISAKTTAALSGRGLAFNLHAPRKGTYWLIKPNFSEEEFDESHNLIISP
jgi:hypothetical protein